MPLSSRLLVLAAAAALFVTRAAAQGNPWALDVGPYRSVAVTLKGAGRIEMGRVLGDGTTTWEGLFTPTAARMSMATTATIQGTTHSGTAWTLYTADTEASDYGGDTVTVEPSFRALLAREFDALGPTARAKVLANIRILGEIAMNELDVPPSAIGEKTGAETVAGHSCDVYTTEKASFCILPQAPLVMLRFRVGEESGYEVSATEVRFNIGVPANAFAYPAGKVVQRLTAAEVMENRRWALDLYFERNDGNEPPSLAALAKFVLEYLSTEDLEGEPDEEGPGGH